MAKRHSKLLGIAVGERSMMIADVASSGEKPDVRRVIEFVYPAGVSIADAAKLGEALRAFLDGNGFGNNTAVIGLPAKWLVVKSKSVPPTDPATLADLLRLQAEGEFTAELKDLVHDYYPGQAENPSEVLLVATQKKYLDAAETLCESARLHLAGVTSSAIALAQASSPGDAMVLAVSPAGAELYGRHGQTVRISHLRSGGTERAFVGELRRAVSTIPANGGGRELILWDGAGLSATTLANELGFPVRSGGFASLGVNAGNNSDGKFAPAVAVAVAGMGDLAVDFQHSKLAVAPRRLVPRWAWIAVAAVVALVAAGVFAYRDLQAQEAAVASLRAQVKANEGTVKTAEQFVSRVNYAKGWHYTDPRYVACLRDLMTGRDNLPDDNQTFATKLSLKEGTRVEKGKTIRTGDLAGELFGKTPDQKMVQDIIDTLKKNPNFPEVSWGEMRIGGRTREVSFSVKFTYRPPASKPVAKK
jgi:hypothetical protein